MTRLQFLLLATVFQGGLCLLGLGLARWQGVEIAWDWSFVSVLRGVVFTIPMAVFLWWTLTSDWPPLKELREFLVHRFGPILKQCSWIDLVYVSLLAGLSEEVLFRGAIQNLFLGWGVVAAIAGTNLLFGLCHAATPVYFVYAFFAGCYLTWVAGVHEQSLSAAIITHGFYDLIALGAIRSMRVSQNASMTGDPSQLIEAPPESEVGLEENQEL